MEGTDSVGGALIVVIPEDGVAEKKEKRIGKKVEGRVGHRLHIGAKSLDVIMGLNSRDMTERVVVEEDGVGVEKKRVVVVDHKDEGAIGDEREA